MLTIDHFLSFWTKKNIILFSFMVSYFNQEPCFYACLNLCIRPYKEKYIILTLLMEATRLQDSPIFFIKG